MVSADSTGDEHREVNGDMSVLVHEFTLALNGSDVPEMKEKFSLNMLDRYDELLVWCRGSSRDREDGLDSREC